MPRSIVTGAYPATRMRRLRQFDWARRLTRETKPSPDDLVWGLIVHDGKDKRVPVKTMPGVDRLNVDEAAKAMPARKTTAAMRPSIPAASCRR
jgi:delta-aminolevulinic acid dehydratase/porphobilinogen synthase